MGWEIYEKIPNFRYSTISALSITFVKPIIKDEVCFTDWNMGLKEEKMVKIYEEADVLIIGYEEPSKNKMEAINKRVKESAAKLKELILENINRSNLSKKKRQGSLKVGNALKED